MFTLLTATVLVANDYFIVEIELGHRPAKQVINDFNLDPVNEGYDGKLEVVATANDLGRLTDAGLNNRILSSLSHRSIDVYQSYEDINIMLESWHSFLPNITELIEIGVSTEQALPIYALKISDNPGTREDEPVVWIDGVHHAREPMSMMSCIKIADYLLSNYGIDTLVTEIVNEIETWIVPIINPEGYVYFIDSTSTYPWWRKNLRDNNENGQFDIDYDGVDLNRNYDCNWEDPDVSSNDPASWVYRGPAPWSESEIIAKRDLALELRPLTGITYHSYGEIIYYKSGINGHSTGETADINAFAYGMATTLAQLDGTGHYRLGATWAEAPMSYYWMYQVIGTWEMLVETGDEFVPDYQEAQQVADDNLPGGIYVLQKTLAGPGIRGHVYSATDSTVVDAIVRIVEYSDPGLTPRRNELVHGRYNRFTSSGDFMLIFSAENYHSDTVSISVADGWTEYDAYLEPFVTAADPVAQPTDILLLNNYPNPFNSRTTFAYELPHTAQVRLVIFDLLGQEVARIIDQRQPAGKYELNWAGGNLATGVYLFQLQADGLVENGKLILLK